MKILLASDAHRIGGAEHYLFLLAQSLKEKGCEIELLCPKRDEWSSFIHKFEECGIKVHRLNLKNRVDLGHLIFLSFLDFPQIHRLKNFFISHKYDLVHINTAGIESGQTLVSAAHLAGVNNIVTTVHTAHHLPHSIRNIQIPFIDSFRHFIVRRNTHSIKKIIAISNSTAQGLIDRYQLNPKIFKVIYNGVDLKDFGKNIFEAKASLHKECGIDENVKIICCVANLFREKGIDYLIHALAKLKGNRYSFLCLIIGEGYFREEFEKYADKMGVRDLVRFPGKRDDVNSILQGSDIFVLPSLSEGFPFVILEAMAAGLPSVVTNVGGIPEMIQDKEQGFIIPPKNPESLAESLMKLLNDESKAQTMGQKAKLRSEKEFSLTHMVNQTIDVYKNVIGEIT